MGMVGDCFDPKLPFPLIYAAARRGPKQQIVAWWRAAIAFSHGLDPKWSFSTPGPSLARLLTGPCLPNAPRALLGSEAVGRNLVTVEVTCVTRVRIWCPPTRPDRALVNPASSESDPMEGGHRRAIRCHKADRAAIGERRRFSIGRL
jgi:hypothetical protein